MNFAACRLEQFIPQALSMSIWSLSALEEVAIDEALLENVAERALALASDFTPLDTCNLLVSLGAFRCEAPPLYVI